MIREKVNKYIKCHKYKNYTLKANQRKNRSRLLYKFIYVSVNKGKLTRTEAKEEMVCQLRFVSLDETLDGSIPMPRLQTRQESTKHKNVNFDDGTDFISFIHKANILHIF